jgi:alpha-amylase/alpha-mannosidase (GH57 family)
MTGPIRLALIWHFHQPDYIDPATAAATMPWTRLHALKDYADMAAFLERHPTVRATFNVVPTLLDQLQALALGGLLPDPFLALALKDPADLSFEERAFVIGHFFSLNRDKMAVSLKRLNELHALRGDAQASAIGEPEVARFDDQALADLQVLFHLAWCGPLLQSDPLIASLRSKGRGFTADDKRALFARQQEFLGDVIPRWRRLYDAEQIELSVTPYYHPILPLLCEVASAQEALPDLRLPSVRFENDEDADLQLVKGMEAFHATFGRRAAGGWPSEGAISQRALQRMGAAGYRWAASDEDVLFASLGETLPVEPAAKDARRAELLYRPWRHGDGPVLLFRDHDLSDRIGFAYATRAPDDAARDFVSRLVHLREVLPDDGTPYVVSVILDGENAWEHYPEHAAPFFDALYGALAAEPRIETVTASEAADADRARPLPRVIAGSWIYRNLATWIGHPEKNRAWELLAAARDAIASARGAPDWHDPAWRMILAAEGSDWFWWYGDDHETAYGAEFDAGFRNKLRGAYAAAGLPAPPVLDEPIRKTPVRGQRPPSGPVDARIDGRVGDYFEWRTAGHVLSVYGATHAAIRFARELFFGTDGRSLFVRVDPFEPGGLLGTTIAVRTPAPTSAVLQSEAGGSAGDLITALDRVLEMSVPLDRLAAPEEPVRFAIEIRDGGGRTQRIPSDGFVELARPEDDPSRYDWSV